VAAPDRRAADPAGKQAADAGVLLTGAVVVPGDDPIAPHPTPCRHQKASGMLPEAFLLARPSCRPYVDNSALDACKTCCILKE
jgi:hypothetical protein